MGYVAAFAFVAILFVANNASPKERSNAGAIMVCLCVICVLVLLALGNDAVTESVAEWHNGQEWSKSQ